MWRGPSIEADDPAHRRDALVRRSPRGGGENAERRDMNHGDTLVRRSPRGGGESTEKKGRERTNEEARRPGTEEGGKRSTTDRTDHTDRSDQTDQSDRTDRQWEAPRNEAGRSRLRARERPPEGGTTNGDGCRRHCSRPADSGERAAPPLPPAALRRAKLAAFWAAQKADRTQRLSPRPLRLCGAVRGRHLPLRSLGSLCVFVPLW